MYIPSKTGKEIVGNLSWMVSFSFVREDFRSYKMKTLVLMFCPSLSLDPFPWKTTCIHDKGSLHLLKKERRGHLVYTFKSFLIISFYHF